MRRASSLIALSSFPRRPSENCRSQQSPPLSNSNVASSQVLQDGGRSHLRLRAPRACICRARRASSSRPASGRTRSPFTACSKMRIDRTGCPRPRRPDTYTRYTSVHRCLGWSGPMALSAHTWTGAAAKDKNPWYVRTFSERRRYPFILLRGRSCDPLYSPVTTTRAVWETSPTSTSGTWTAPPISFRCSS